MGNVLKRRLKQLSFESAEQEAILNILVSSNHVKSKIESVCTKHGITISQFNVLRILNGKYPEGYPRCDIISRMIDPAPDVTRLIDRLIRQGFVERYASTEDRRLSIARITNKGIAVLNKIKPKIDELNSLISSTLNIAERKQLSILLEKVYSDLF
ncbi:MAG: MarR family transcriptional regulator [Bacteroidetes bacterium]|nr:MarR family transcriptional regulator [Bacteroidota bacterium]MCH9029371.1 MarR family transcriptional regulator [Bacteroidota bacterium]